MPKKPKYTVCIIRRKTTPVLFHWEILRKADGREVARSSRNFRTRLEALVDSAKVAAAWAFDLDTESENVQPASRKPKQQ